MVSNITEAYSKLSQASKMDLFKSLRLKAVNYFGRILNFYLFSFILDFTHQALFIKYIILYTL